MRPAELDLLSASALLGWLATYLIHSTLWLAGAWVVARWTGSAAWRERLWRGAVLGGLVSSAFVVTLKTSRVGWRLETPRVDGTSAASGLESSAEAIALDLSPSAARAPAALPSSPPTPIGPLSEPSRTAGWTPSSIDWSRWLVGLWLVGAALGLGHLARQHRRLGRALAARRALNRGPLREQLERLKASTGSRRRARLSVSASLPSPIALARGEIVVPERALERLTGREREVLLAHEFAHLERRDPWWLLGLSLVERALFVQPLNRLATSRSVQAAELACDELAARWTRGEVELARCLAEVASWSETSPARGLTAGLAERPSALVERIERLLAPRDTARRQGWLVGTWLAGSLVALAWAGPHVTAAPAQEPEVAELRPVSVQARILPAASSQPDAELPGRGLVRVGDELIEYRASAQEGSGTERERLEQRIRRYLQDQATIRRMRTTLDDAVASIEKRIAEHEQARRNLKPSHSRWQRAQSEIDQLEAALARLLEQRRLSLEPQDPRMTQAIDVLDDCPEAQIAFHVGVREDGVDPTPTAAAEHALELRADGSIWCGKMQMVLTGSQDERLLRFHLSEIARCMPKAPLAADRPDGPLLPDAWLELRIDEEAPHSLLQRVLQTCGMRDVQIWKLELVPVQDGHRGAALRFALPRDVGVSDTPLEREPGPLEISARVLSAGDPRMLEYVAGYTVAVTCDDQGRDVPIRESRTTTELASLAAFLQQVNARMPRRRVLIDARPGTLYADVTALLDVIVEAGFTDISFVGLRQR